MKAIARQRRRPYGRPHPVVVCRRPRPGRVGLLLIRLIRGRSCSTGCYLDHGARLSDAVWRAYACGARSSLIAARPAVAIDPGRVFAPGSVDIRDVTFGSVQERDGLRA